MLLSQEKEIRLNDVFFFFCHCSGNKNWNVTLNTYLRGNCIQRENGTLREITVQVALEKMPHTCL